MATPTQRVDASIRSAIAGQIVAERAGRADLRLDDRDGLAFGKHIVDFDQ